MSEYSLLQGKNRKKTAVRRDWRKWGFYASIITIPIINFIVFTLGGLASTIGYGFFGYSYQSDRLYWNNFENFVNVFHDLFQGGTIKYFGVSFIYFFSGLVIGELAAILPLYCWKKFPGAELFRTLSFIPTIIPGIVWVTLFSYIAESPSVSNLFNAPYGLLTFPEQGFWTLFFYTFWMSLCGGVLINVGIISGVSPDIVDAAHIDGCGLFREYLHVVIPYTWQFKMIGYITGLVGLFMGGPDLYTFYGSGAPESMKSFSYYLFTKVMRDPNNKPNQLYSAAASFMVTCIVAPLTFLLKHMLEKYGPRED